MKAFNILFSTLVFICTVDTLFCQPSAYLPQKMAFAHILKQSDKEFFIVSQSDAYNYRDASSIGNVGNETDSNVTVIYKYEPEFGKFKKMTSLNTCKFFFGAVLGNSKIYILGGFNSQMQASNELLEFDLKVGEWKKLASMKNKRAKFVCEYHNNKIYVLNGIGNAGNFEVFDIATGKWSTLVPNIISSQVTHLDTIAASDIIDASIYFISPDGKKFFEYHVLDNKLINRSMPSFSKTDFGFTAHNKKVYVADGYNQGKIDGRIYVYHALTDKWEPAGFNPFARSGVAMLFYNNSLFFIGGNDSDQYPTDIISLSKPMK